MKASKLLKYCMFGLVAATGIGFISLPAKADEIIQDGHQTTVQDGAYNTSVEQLDQNAEVKDWQRDYYGHYDRYDNDDVVRQGADQFGRQQGYNNTSVQQSSQDAKIRKEGRLRY